MEENVALKIEDTAIQVWLYLPTYFSKDGMKNNLGKEKTNIAVDPKKRQSQKNPRISLLNCNR